MNQVIETSLIYLAAIGNLRDFMELGGPVMWLIALTSFILWTLIVARLYYFHFGIREDVAELQKDWGHRHHYLGWQIKHIRAAMIASHHMKCFSQLGLIKALVAIVPFLGLLGTVTGMIEVFDVLAQTGASNARAMAAGVSKATLPTMAGMVVALSGLYFSSLLERRAEKNMRQCENLLKVE